MAATYPNFLLVGAAKSGTTSLYHYLRQHPDIYMSPVKEPLFFSSYGVETSKLEKEIYPVSLEEVVKDRGRYMGLFDGVEEETAIGEASVYYLLDHTKTIRNIKMHISDWERLKIVIILRNPVDASFSNYTMYSQHLQHYMNMEKVLSFEDSLFAEPERIRAGYIALAHFHWFFYCEQVKDYLENFRNVKIVMHSDLQRNPGGLIKDLFEFLSVDSSFIPATIGHNYNSSGVPRSKFIYRFFTREGMIKKVIRPLVRLLLTRERREILSNSIWRRNLVRPTMKPETRERLKKYYQEDVMKLQRLIDVDLSHWIR